MDGRAGLKEKDRIIERKIDSPLPVAARALGFALLLLLQSSLSLSI
jgi:hypothetical protein